MDFPVFHLDFFGNRLMVAVVAIVHVLVNHGLAVGAIPLVALLEWWGRRTGEPAWDRLAWRILFTCFIITTTLGALTGVGIWFTTSLANPYAIASLIRVFFWAWFTEWIVFVTEVVLILAYTLTWKHMAEGRAKKLHNLLGLVLAIASWLTMAIIVAILGFMMDTGRWAEAPGFIQGVLNPIYLPQLLFRTPLAMSLAGLFGLFMAFFFLKEDRAFRDRAVRFIAGWSLAWLPLLVLGSWVYWRVIPEVQLGSLPVAMTTQAFQDWYRVLGWIIAGASVAIVVVAGWAVALPRWFPRVALLVPAVLAVSLLGMFERVREFIRKPDVIEAYRYANGVRHEDLPLLQQDGMLAHAAYAAVREVTDENRLVAGREVFSLACTRCHTTTGVNGVVRRLDVLFGPGWTAAKASAYIKNMHNVRYYMPPFPGSEEELDALAAWLVALRDAPARLDGAQASGVALPPPAAADVPPLVSGL